MKVLHNDYQNNGYQKDKKESVGICPQQLVLNFYTDPKTKLLRLFLTRSY